MALDPGVEDALRQWIGSTPDSTDLEAIYGLIGPDIHVVALSILRRRRADLAANPSKFTLTDGYSEDFTGALAALNATINQLAALVDDGAGKVQTVKMRRIDPSRGLPGEYGCWPGFVRSSQL